MDFLHKTCSICLSKDKKLKNLFNFDHDGINFYSKLTAAFNNMCLKKYNKQRHICEECSITLDIVYNFWKKCVASRTTLQNYISQLNVDGIEESNDCVSDVNNYIKVSRIKPSKTNKVKVIPSNINTIEDNLEANLSENNTNTIHNQTYVEFNQLEVKTEPDFQGGNNTVNSTSGNIIVKTEPRCHDDDISLTPTNEIVDQIEVKTERINDDEISDSNLTNSLNCVDVFHEKKTSFEEIHIKTEIEDEDFVGCSETSIEIKDEIDIDENNWVSDGKKKELNSLKSDEQQDIKATDDQNSTTAESWLPKKSKDAYQNEYHKFERWLARNCVEIINETVLLRYFKELSETFSPNSLLTKYSMLKKNMSVRKNIDIGTFHNLGRYLKQGTKGYETKKSKVLTREQMLDFIHDAPNETYLMIKVALLFGVLGGCRRQELVNMLVDHIEDRGPVLVVNIPETKTNRVFTIIEEKEMNSLQLIKEYASLRPQACSEKRFFLNYRNGRCTAQPVGKNTFGRIPSTIARYLNLKDADKYTGHCLRRTATLLVDARVGMATLKRHRGLKSTDGTSSNKKISKMSASQPSTSVSIESIASSNITSGNMSFTEPFHSSNYNIHN